MTYDEAREQLRRLVAADTFPTLDGFELRDLLRLARRPDYRGVLDADVPDPNGWPRTALDGAHTIWAPGVAYAADAIVVPATRDGRIYRVTTGGTSGATEPVWAASGPITDGSVTWEATTGVVWTPTYDLNYAAAEGWRWKAGKASDRTNFSSQGGNYNPEQVYQHCVDMAKYFDSKAMATSIPIVTDRTSPYYNIPRAN